MNKTNKNLKVFCKKTMFDEKNNIVFKKGEFYFIDYKIYGEYKVDDGVSAYWKISKNEKILKVDAEFYSINNYMFIHKLFMNKLKNMEKCFFADWFDTINTRRKKLINEILK